MKRFAVAVVAAAAVSGASVASSSADIQTQINSSKSTASSLQSQISSETAQIEKTSGGVASAKAQLASVQANLEGHITQLRDVQTQVMQARDNLLSLERKLTTASKYLEANLRAAYENGSPSLVDAVLSSNGFSDLLNKVNYIKDAQKSDAEMVQVTQIARKRVQTEALNLGKLEMRDRALTNDILEQRNQVAATEAALVQQQIDEQSTRNHAKARLADVQTQTAKLQKKEAAIEAAAVEQAHESSVQVNQQVGGIAINTGSMIQAPANAPAQIREMIAAGNAIATLPYIWGGGHGSFISPGYDCSGSVSFVLNAAGLLSAPETSGTFESYGAPGAGQWVTIYANSGHVWMQIAGWRFDTVALAETGTRWSQGGGEYGGFVVRHPVGF